MNPTIFLSCLVVTIGGLPWTASARGDQKFHSQLTRFKNIYGNDSVDRVTKLRNVPDLMDFYEKYSNRFQLTREERLEADRMLRQYKEATTKQPSTEGVPLQGGFIPDFYDRFFVEIITKIINKPAGNQN